MIALLASTLALPTLASAQTGVVDTVVEESEQMPRLRALGVMLTRVTTPELLISDCFRECFTRDTAARAQVCASTPNPQICLGRNDIPACILARRSMRGGIDVNTFASCPPAAPSVVAAAPSAEELARRQHRREQAVRACAGQGAFAPACIQCSSAAGRTWLSVNTEHDRSIVAAALGEHPSNEAVANFRCMTVRMLPYHNILAATRTEVANVRAEVQGVQTRVATMERNGSHGFSTDVARSLSEIIDALGSERATREYERAITDVRACEVTAPSSLIPPRERALPLAPAEMVFWPDDAVRAEGYRPRVREPVVRCTAERERLTLARAVVDRYTAQSSTHASVDRLHNLTVFLDAIVRDCASEGTSEACTSAHESFRAFMGRFPFQAPQSTPPVVDRLAASNP